MFVVRDTDRRALAVVPVARFDHDRVANLLGDFFRTGERLHLFAAWHRNAGVVEQRLGRVLVARDLDGDHRRPARGRRLDPLLP